MEDTNASYRGISGTPETVGTKAHLLMGVEGDLEFCSGNALQKPLPPLRGVNHMLGNHTLLDMMDSEYLGMIWTMPGSPAAVHLQKAIQVAKGL